MMKSWRLLVHANGQRLCTRGRTALGFINRNIQLRPYGNLSYGAVASCSSGTESGQSRQAWTPKVFGVVGVGLLLCGGREGIFIKIICHYRDVTTKLQLIKKPNSR